MSADEPGAPDRRTFRLSDDDLPAALLFIVLAAVACSIPAQSDTFYHLRAGRVMVESGQLLERELFSHATYGEAHPNHWWLASWRSTRSYVRAVRFSSRSRRAAARLLAVAGAWRFTRGNTSEGRLLLLLVLMLTLPAWSVRPQVFSLVLMVITLRLVLADRLAWLPLVMVLWANVHAVVVLGIAVVFVVFVEALLWSRDRIWRTFSVAAASAAAPMVSPLGLHYWPYVLTVVREARTLGITSIAPRSRWNGRRGTVAGHHGARRNGGTPVANARGPQPRRADSAAGERGAGGVRGSVRAEHRLLRDRRGARVGTHDGGPVTPQVPSRAESRLRVHCGRRRRGIGGVGYRWRDGGAALGWRPFTPEALRAIRECPPPMYNGFNDGGLLIWFAPGQRVFVDGRSDAYPLDLLLRASRAELRGDYRELFAEYRFSCAVVGAMSVMARALGSDPSMQLHFSDERWAVFHVTGR